MQKVKKFLKNDFVIIIYLTIIVFIFFFNLFFPKLQAITTPDFGQSDVFQLNVPLKYFLAENLKNNQLPLWNPYIANGFPALAEGQTGTFFILNLLLFKFLPFPLAFNLGIVSIFITTAIGTYLFCREIKLSQIAGFFSAITFTFSGFFIGHLTHFNLIQAASLFPLLLYLTLKILKSVKTRKLFLWGGLFSLVLSQQLFAGFPQVVIITLIWVFLLYFLLMFFNKKLYHKAKLFLFLYLALFTLLGFLIAAVQLIPQFEFLQISTRNKLEQSQTSYFSYPFKHLITLISPYYLGSPKLGTYPPFNKFDGSIFWENTGYIGLIGIILALLGLFLKSPYKKFLLISVIFSFFLMTGKYSPLYFMFKIPPLSLFRVPSRFILPFVFTLIILFGITLNLIFIRIRLVKNSNIKKFLIIVILIILSVQIIDLWGFGKNYHPLSTWTIWLKKPQTAEYIMNNNKPFERTVTLGDTQEVWNEVFTTKGWQNTKPYNYFRNDLNPNINVLYGLKTYGVYRVQTTKRYDYFESILSAGINNTETIIISTQSANLLATISVGNLITTKGLEISGKRIEPVFETSIENSLSTYKVYRLKEPKECYLTTSYKKAETVEDVFNYLNNNIDLNQTVILEKDMDMKNEDKMAGLNNNIKIISDTNLLKLYEITASQSSIFVIPQSFYPGWKAEVDEKKQEVLAANVNSQAVYLDKGKHNVTLFYYPKSLIIGALISISGLFITFLMIFVALSKAYCKYLRTQAS